MSMKYKQMFEKQKKMRRSLSKNGMYNEEDEHSSSGVGLVVSIDAKLYPNEE